QRDQSLRMAHANGVAHATTSDVPNVWGLEGLNRDPGYWTNQCIAGYYGVQTVTIAQ
ncbi:MAG: hypothetical protein JOZ57_09190, partial [Abitibacteriaceae bacterium]|nr:hypothetical protein [Abditibacteriaceae bacterium]